MNVDNQLVAYLNEQIGSYEDIVKFAKDNAFYYSIAYLLGNDIHKQFYYKTNKLRYEIYFKSLVEICDSFVTANVNPLYFKGMALANRLYDEPQKRYVGDIDIFVEKRNFPIALAQLIKLGYVFRDKNTFYNEHHIVLIRENVTVELHKNVFNPIIGINEKYLLSNTETFKTIGNSIMTFNITASFLHLIYHLYMDTWLTVCSLYPLLTCRLIPKTKRFIYRAYEIALFSENYFNEISWEDIINDIKKQKLRIIFNMMINDIIEIFPNTFPKSFIDAVNNMEYVIYEKDDLYKYVMDSNSLNKNIDAILSGYIDSQWNNRVYKNLQIDSVGGFTLDNPIIKDQEINNNYLLTCNVQVKKSENGIKLVFKVTNDDFYFSKAKDYDTLTSDGVHLIICGTKKYSYNSIFLFPKIVDDEIVVIPVNVLNSENSEISDLLISTSYQKFETEYIITAVLKNEFLKRNNIEKHFYLGLVISDCSSKTKKRKGELILSNPYNEWYNPVYFAKVNI